MVPDSVTVDLTPTDRVIAAARAYRELRDTLADSFGLDREQLARIAELALTDKSQLRAETSHETGHRCEHVDDKRLKQLRQERDHARLQHDACLSIAEGRSGWQMSSFDDSPAMLAVRALQHRVVQMLDTGREQSKGIEGERDEARRQLAELELEKRDLESRIGFLEEQSRRALQVASPGRPILSLANDGATVKAVRELRQSRDRLNAGAHGHAGPVDQRLEQFRQEVEEARRQLDTIKGVAEGVPGLDSWSSMYIAPVRQLRRDYDRLSVNTAKLTERLAEANNRLAHSGFETV